MTSTPIFEIKIYIIKSNLWNSICKEKLNISFVLNNSHFCGSMVCAWKEKEKKFKESVCNSSSKEMDGNFFDVAYDERIK